MPAWVVPAIIGAVSLVSSLVGQSKQKKENRKLAEFQAAENEKYLDKQLAYNTPQAQMSRFQDAGLNPHLIYGQGNPGNQSAPLQYPETKTVDYGDLGVSGALQLANQTALASSQIEAQNANTRRTGVLTQLNQLQADVLAKNPYLNPAAYDAIISTLKSTAESKAAGAGVDTAKAEWFLGKKSFNVDGVEMHGPAGAVQMETELKLLLQKFDLGSADQKIKAQVIESKEFQNAILDVQKKFMTSGDITPQHIYQFIILLLTKLL